VRLERQLESEPGWNARKLEGPDDRVENKGEDNFEDQTVGEYSEDHVSDRAVGQRG